MNVSYIFLALFLAPVVSSVPIALAYRRRGLVEKLPPLSAFGIFVSLICSIMLLHFPDRTFSYPWLPQLGIDFVLRTDYLSSLMGVVTALIAFIIAVYGLDYMKGDYRLPWYWFFFNLFTASMLLVVYSDNLFLLFVGWEGLGIASWGLIGHWYRDDDDITFVGVPGRKIGPHLFCWPPSFGGWRAISTIRLGDVPMFLAIAALWALSPEHDINISQMPWEEILAGIGAAGTVLILTMFLIGLFTKSAQLPFSEWLMTAMTGPTTVSALLHSATMVAAGAFVFMKVSWYIQPWELAAHVQGLEVVYLLALLVGLFSALYGALVATGMLERKVLLAASTMSSLGLMFGTAAASCWIHEEIAGMNLALLVAFWYMVVHAFAKATLFLVSGHLIHATHSRFSEGDLELAGRMKTAFVATLIATTFLVGIPPLTAYWVKSAMDEVMEHLLLHEYMLLPLALLLATSITYSAILARFFSLNFFKGEKPHHLHLERLPLMELGYLAMVSVLFVILYLLFERPELVELAHAGFKLSSLAVGLAVLVAFLVAFFKPRVAVLSKIGTFFNDRMYMPFLNDLVCPVVGFAVARLVDYGNRGIDAFFNTRVMPTLFAALSKRIRAIQVGYLRSYTRIVLGLVMIFLIGVAVWGVLP
ncbi:MAG: Membrane H+-translocase/NADH:ubiquinone oxidoreductase subunit 5 /Multisubunit Na+/H+ antiporter [Candidatus Alkanophagales archaeon MCA70_species_2]|nr:Membrane H+-translocase/NADH:ubiquinone oxidoreductase subunit 5 /Multisubunit Na+/H+ antiporter [Candidatus Alkanophaga liquidiphilum]